MIDAVKTQLRRVLPQNRFARSVSVLAGGTAAGQLVVVAASPVLTRLYIPEDFGLLAVYAGLLGILSVIASLRYQLAIPLPESDEEAASAVVLSLLVVLGMTGASAVVLWIWGGPIAATLNTPTLEPYLWLLPIGLFLSGIYQVFNYWAIRVNAFPAIARTKMIQALSMVAVQLGGYALGPLALLLGQVSGQAAGTSSLGLLAIRRKWATFCGVRLADVQWAAGRYRSFPIYSSWGALFNKAGTELPAVLFAASFGPAAAGLYVLSHRVVVVPKKLISRAIADVLIPIATDARRHGGLGQVIVDTHQKLAYVIMPPAFLLFIAGPDAFALIFGEEWRKSGEIAKLLAPWVYINFVTSPLSTLFFILERQALGMVFDAGLLIARLGALIIGGLHGDLMLAVGLFSAAGVIFWAGFLIWAIHCTGGSLSRVCRTTAKAFIWTSVVFSPIVGYYSFRMAPEFGFFSVFISTVLVSGYYQRMLRTLWS